MPDETSTRLSPGQGGALSTRIARACENCRARRIKCIPPYPCTHCRDAGLDNCEVRDKARPRRTKRSTASSSAAPRSSQNRRGHVRTYPIVGSQEDDVRGAVRTPTQPDVIEPTTHATILGSTLDRRTDFIGLIEGELEAVHLHFTGRTIDLALHDLDNHPSISLDSPLPAFPMIIHDQGLLAILAFNRHMLPFCSYLTEARTLDLYQRYSDLPRSMSPDLLALIFACLALGFLRLKSFQTADHMDRPVPNNIPEDDPREDVAFFRHAVRGLERWGSVSFISLQALSVLQFYSMCTSAPASTRLIISWMVSQTRELGIHRTGTSRAYSPGDRADLMLFLVLFLDGQYASLCGQPPLLRYNDYDVGLILVRQTDTGPSSNGGLVPRRSLAELVLLQSEMQETLCDQSLPRLSLNWILAFQAKWAQWVAVFVQAQRTTGNPIVDSFVAIHWQWDRIMLWFACVRDDRLSCSAWAGLARGAVHILSKYRSLYTTASYNFVWTHLRRIVTCAHLILLCFWRCELEKGEAELYLAIALSLLELSSTRWPSATRAREKVEEVARSLSLQLPEPNQLPAQPFLANSFDPLREETVDTAPTDPIMLLFEQSFINPDASGGYAFDMGEWARGAG